MDNARKYIIIPEYKPLYAMRKCFGPEHGPLQKPCLTPVDIIGELIAQKEKVTVFEVKKLSDGIFCDPIQLTADNYMLPYDEIVSGVSKADAPESVKEPKAPVVAEAVAEIVPETEPEVMLAATEEDHVITEHVEPTVEAVDSEKVIGAADEASITNEDAPAEPAKHMTKAERRAARRNNQ